ncbi:MAG: CPBP family intramembrane glutamic endopeptidase [Candidatus Jordarchaeales archaeon]
MILSREADGGVTWGWFEALLVYALSILLLFLFQEILFIVGLSMIMSMNPFLLLRVGLSFNILYGGYEVKLMIVTPPELLFFVTLGELSLLATPLLYLKLRGIPYSELGLRTGGKRVALTDIAVGCLTGMGMTIAGTITTIMTSLVLLPVLQVLYGTVLGALLLWLTEEFLSEITLPFMAANPAQLLLLLASVTLLVAPCEEVATRGFLQRGLEKSWGRWRGLVAAALIFSLIHVVLYPQRAATSTGLLEIGIIGIILALPTYIVLSLTLGAIFQARDYRLLTTIAAHATYMIILVTILSL